MYVRENATASGYYFPDTSVVESRPVIKDKQRSDARCLSASSSWRTDMQEIENQIKSLANGDTSAMGSLYERAKSAVYGLSLSIVKNSHDAEDVMQDTFIRVYEGSASYRAEGKPMAWILRIARNLSLDIVRSNPAQELSLEAEWILDADSDFSESSLDKLVLKMVLSQLDEEERQIVMLHSVERLKHREIAEILDIPLGTELSKYHRSLKKLRGLLEEKTK
ncbi:MAG: RNA polymerase sigma factor [Eubacteriales bacterium]|nr:RNA polymerase sigma factor [Eubacteriales bacterium]MDD4324633.1 RNA polymerase sigma factor [Eubacteriales bacterium]MDD4540828.1 RNA polymerase sigma factor [Eubacteriales bacterium]